MDKADRCVECGNGYYSGSGQQPLVGPYGVVYVPRVYSCTNCAHRPDVATYNKLLRIAAFVHARLGTPPLAVQHIGRPEPWRYGDRRIEWIV